MVFTGSNNWPGLNFIGLWSSHITATAWISSGFGRYLPSVPPEKGREGAEKNAWQSEMEVQHSVPTGLYHFGGDGMDGMDGITDGLLLFSSIHQPHSYWFKEYQEWHPGAPFWDLLAELTCSLCDCKHHISHSGDHYQHPSDSLVANWFYSFVFSYSNHGL